MTAGRVREKNREREKYLIEEGTRVLTVEPVLKIFWECELMDLLKTDNEWKEFYDSTFDTGAIKIRDAFYGGRVGVERMHVQPTPGKSEIKWKDIKSL